MNLEMNKNSLFAVLLRSPWWMSAGIALAIGLLARMLLPSAYVAYGAFAALPFVVIAGMTGWRAFRAPSAGRVSDMLGALRAVAWPEFARALEAGFKRDGYVVTRGKAAPVDFELLKGHRTALVYAKRWKVARTGIEPLRELVAAKETHEAHECIYIAAGDFTDQARAFATQNKVRLIHDADLVRLLPSSLVRRAGA